MLALIGALAAFCVIAVISSRTNPLPTEEQERIRLRVKRFGYYAFGFAVFLWVGIFIIYFLERK